MPVAIVHAIVLVERVLFAINTRDFAIVLATLQCLQREINGVLRREKTEMCVGS